MDYAGWVHALRVAEPSALAILLFGSRARGDDGPYSDVNLRVITAIAPVQQERMWFVPEGGRLLQLTITAQSLPETVNSAENYAEWSWLKPAHDSAVVLWGDADAVRLLHRMLEGLTPPSFPYLDALPLSLRTLLQHVSKVKNAHADRNYRVAALASSCVAQAALRTLHCVAPTVQPHSGMPQHWLDEREIERQIPGCLQALDICQGTIPRARSLDELLQASIQLSLIVIDWVATQLPADPPAPDSLDALLSHGTLRRYITQLVSPEWR